MLEKILSILADGEFHSGDEIGQVLGVSRTAVWKHLQKVEELGLSVVSTKGKGYRVDGGIDQLSVIKIQQMLNPNVRGLIQELELASVVSSTNQLAMEKAVAGRHGYVCSVEQQTAGRGRRGRAWVSPYAANIYLSVVWEFAGGAAALEGLSLAVGVAVVDALSRVGVSGLQLKWPNDVLHDGKKLAGILLEMVGDAAGPCRVVVGVGLNVAMPPSAGVEIDQPWTDIKAIAPSCVSRNLLLAELLNSVIPMLSEFEQKGFGCYRDQWMSLDAYRNQEVVIRLGERLEPGIALGVDASGAIIVDTEQGVRTFTAGEVSLRGAV